MITLNRAAVGVLAVIMLAGVAGCSRAPIAQAPFDDVRDLSGRVPVVPGAEGFGTDTPAGRGGAIVRVTTLAGDGPGSLREALTREGPRTIVFEVGGVIDIVHPLVVSQPFVTVAGQTAPPPGITIIGAGLVIITHDVLVQHLRFRVGDRPEGPDPNGRDGLSIYTEPGGATEAYNVVIDHCSMSWAIDEGASTWHPNVRDITFRHCIIAENLSRSLHPKREHSKGLLIGNHSRRVAVIGCLFAHNMDRSPHIKGDVSALVANNVIYNPGKDAIVFSDPERAGAARATLLGNVMIPGADTRRGTPVARTRFDTKPNSRIHAADNVVAGPRAGKRPALRVRKACLSDDRPVDLRPLTLRPSGETLEWVLANAGARPGERDATDLRVVDHVREGTGRIIDSQEEVGGFPAYAPVTRPLEPPDDPHTDDNGNGYTRLEEWLQSFAAVVGPSEP